MIQILDDRTNFHIVDDLLGVSSIGAGPRFEFIDLLDSVDFSRRNRTASRARAVNQVRFELINRQHRLPSSGWSGQTMTPSHFRARSLI